MIDDWNLKDEAIIPTYKNEEILYNESDIETLRKKLIEDIKQFLTVEFIELEPYEIDEYMDDINGIINKRFGVKE